jgi:NitT/TauT family transport system ATP-binding protein
LLTVPPLSSINVKSLGRVFGRIAALRGVSLDLHSGRVYALLGRSGCGKSTFVKILAGILCPSDGEINVFGATPQENARTGGVGYLPQESALMPWLTVTENVEFPLKVLAGPFSALSFQSKLPHIDRALDLMAVNFETRLYPDQLSGGMKMRCALARSIVHEPKLLLLDEPFSDLDFVLREDLYRRIRILAEELRMLVIVVTHDITEAITVADRVFVFRRTLSVNQNSLCATIDVPIQGIRDAHFAITPAFSSCYKQIAAAIAEE